MERAMSFALFCFIFSPQYLLKKVVEAHKFCDNTYIESAFKRRSQGTIGCVSLGIYGGEPNEREALLGETQSIIRGSDISNALVCK